MEQRADADDNDVTGEGYRSTFEFVMYLFNKSAGEINYIASLIYRRNYFRTEFKQLQKILYSILCIAGKVKMVNNNCGGKLL